MPLSHLLIDLDDTLYPAGNGVWEAIGERIERYMKDVLAIPAEEIPALRHHYHRHYGTTLRGLAFTREIDPLDYLAYVHDIPLETYLQPDPISRAALSQLPWPMTILTNADRAHAERVLKMLDLQDLFQDIFDIQLMWPDCKPMEAAYQKVLAMLNQEPDRILFLDDTDINLVKASEMGMRVLKVGQPPAQSGSMPWIASPGELPDWLRGEGLL